MRATRRRSDSAAAPDHLNKRIDAAINSAFFGLDGLCNADEASAIDNQFGPAASTYGEVTLEGGRTILQALLCHAARNACFLDLGSGEGKMVALAAVGCAGFSRSMGVEHSPTRHASAILACERLRATVDPRERSCACIQLSCGDMLHAHAEIAAATHVYLSSVMFSVELMLLLAPLLDSSPNLRAVASLQEFPAGSDWSFVRSCGLPAVRASMSWHAADDDTEVFVYRRSQGPAPVVRLLWTYSASPSAGGCAGVRIWIRSVRP